MTLWDCHYCETINVASNEFCLACQAVKMQLVERPALQHPLLLKPVPAPATSSGSSRASAARRGPIIESAHFPASPEPKKSMWKKMFGG